MIVRGLIFSRLYALCDAVFQPGRRVLLLLLLPGLLTLMACSPTQGDDEIFDPLPTTNSNFESPRFLQVGNIPITMDITFSPGGVVDLVAVVNRQDNNVEVLENDGSANFTRLALLPIGEQGGKIFWADLDGGANELDLVLFDEANSNVVVFLSDGPRSWAPQPNAFPRSRASDRL